MNDIIDKKIIHAVKRMETYIEKALDNLKTELLKCFSGILYNILDNDDRSLLKIVVNSAAKRTMGKKVQFVPGQTHLDIYSE